MKNHTAAYRILFCAAFLFALGPAGRAQVGGDPNVPPAYGVAQRLIAEAQAARASGQAEVAHNRAYQAVLQFQAVVKSRAYGHTTYARESLRQQATVEENFLQDKNAAIQSLQALHNTFPDDQAVLPQIKRLGDQLNTWNRTFAPPPAPPIHNFGAALYRVMDFLVSLTGRQSWSYWVAILLISALVKLILTPFSNKQYASMREMQRHQPALKALQEKHKNDKELLGRKTMEFYKDNGVNPAAGCLPLFATLPVMYTTYYAIRLYQYQFTHGTFLWIGSGLSHQFPAYLGTNLGQPDIPILLLYAASMYVTQKMMVTPTADPQQAETQKMMAIMTPFMTTYFFLQYHLPSAFVLYYLVFNILSTAQQKYYMRGGPSVGGGTPVLLDGAGPAIRLNGARNGNGAHANGSAPARTELEVKSNGTAPAAKGVIAPKKVHPKKKRR